MPRWLKRTLTGGILLVITAGLGAPYLRADYFRQRIQEALERGLGRKVDVDAVHFTLFAGPGFRVSGVTIHDDPRVGIEPLAYVDSLEARVHPASLWSGRLEFSSLRLTETTVNLIKPDDGPWNFQRLIERSAEEARAMPPIYVRSSRVNFKFGDTKAVVYFRDADLDIDPGDGGRIQIKFAGDPARTDRAQQGYGRVTANGSWRTVAGSTGESQLDLLIELERSSIPEIAHLLDGQDLGVQGVVSTSARVAGLVSNLQISGKLQVEDLRRTDLGGRGGSWKIPYRGTLDLRGEKLALETVSGTETSKKTAAEPAPVSWKVAGTGLMSKPRWEASVEMKELPAASFVEIAQHLGLAYPLPGAAIKSVIDGKLDGSISYSSDAGFRGQVVAQDALLTLPGARPIRLRRAELVVDNQQWRIEPSALEIGEGQAAEMQGSYSLADRALEIRVSTEELKVAELQTSTGRLLGAASVPLLESAKEGIWKGWVRYRRAGEADGEWTGEYELQNVVLDVEGLADPVHIAGASVSMDGPRMTVRRLRARAGKIAFEGEFRRTAKTDRLELAIDSMNVAELERLLAPTLTREQGFLARTLRFGRVEAPEWLKKRRVDATVSVEELRAGEYIGSIDAATIRWDGTNIKISSIDGSIETAEFSGALDVDLRGRVPRYAFRGKVADAPYHGGKVELEGKLESSGAGAQILAGARGEGSMKGRALSFAPDAELRSVSSQFEFTVGAAGLRWKLSNVEAAQGSEVYTGQGATQADGKLVVELTGRRPLRLTANP